MKLLIVRHAIAMEREDDRRENDDFRPLTMTGVKKMRKNAKGLANLVDSPRLLLASPLTRALQTAEILRSSLWPSLEITETKALRPDAAPEVLVSWLKEKLGASEVMESSDVIVAVGHEPHLSSLVGWFLSGEFRSFVVLKKGGACLLEFPERMEKGTARLKWLLTPSQLRATWT